MHKVLRDIYLLFNEVVFGRIKTKQTGSGYRMRANLKTGGFVEIERSNDSKAGIGYVRIHLGKPTRVHSLDETYKYVHYGTNRDNLSLLNDISIAVMVLEDEYHDYCRRTSNKLP